MEARDAGAAVGRGWPRAAGLLGVTLATSVVDAKVLVAVPFLFLVVLGGVRRPAAVAAMALAVFLVATGGHDGLWFAERAWALLVGGVFVALTLARPATPVSSRALGAVFGALAVAVVVLGLREGSFATLDFAMADLARGEAGRMLDAYALLRGGQALAPSVVGAVYDTVEAEVHVFPAMICIASMAAIGVAWWLAVRLGGGGDQGLGPVRNYRFNDHLVWLLIGGLVLLVAGWGDSVVRIGSNTVVFMGALYALRGAAVFMFISGGMSFFGYFLVAMGLLVLPPVVVGIAMMIGIGDTWLDVRARFRDSTA